MGIVGKQHKEAHRQGDRDGRLKVHLRLVRLGGQTYRMVTLRPGTRVAYSTNYFHNTWHVVSDEAGSRLLARLLWGLSYQRQPGTLVLVHGDHLRPTPFEAERSDPFLLLPSHLTHPDPAAFRRLKSLLPRLGPPDRTVRWLTFGMDAALRAPGKERETLHRKDHDQLWRQERMARCGGFICYSAPPPVLRVQALTVHSLRVRQGNHAGEMDYHFLADGPGAESWSDGEVQIFADYFYCAISS